MKYQNVREEISTGDILAWSGVSWFSKIVRWWTKSKFSHIGIAYKTETRVFIIESMDAKGVRIFPLSRSIPFFWIKTNINWTEELEEFVMRNIGEPYSWIGCIKAGFGIKTRDDNRFQCAEFVNHVLKIAGFHTIDYAQTPGKLIDILIKNHYSITYIDGY